MRPRGDGRIAFQNTLESTDIWIVNANGAGLRNLTNSPGSEELEPSWSPDSRRIAFASDRGGDQFGPTAIYVMNANGSGVRALVKAGLEQRSPAWSPDGKLVAFSLCTHYDDLGVCNSAQIVVVPPSGRPLRYLTRPSLRVNAVDTKPAWSPDGKQLVFTRTIDHGFNTLWMIGVDGRNLRRLLDDRSQVDHSPSWSPDGKRIVYMSDRTGIDAILTIDATGTNSRVLIADSPGDPDDPDSGEQGVSSPTFSPSGRRIVFTRGDQLWTMNLAGRDLVRITEDGGDEADWGRLSIGEG